MHENVFPIFMEGGILDVALIRLIASIIVLIAAAIGLWAAYIGIKKIRKVNGSRTAIAGEKAKAKGDLTITINQGDNQHDKQSDKD